MIRTLLLSLLLLPVYTPAFARKNKATKGHCGVYFSSDEAMRRVAGPLATFYDFRKGQRVASIGAQCCTMEAAYAALSDSLDFYLQDIDSTYCNRQQADFAWRYYDTLDAKHRVTSSKHIIIGGEKETRLPDNFFDKILVTNTFHEFTFPSEMLRDIASKLKDSGILYIYESMPQKAGQLHGQCKKPMYSREELLAIPEKNGFSYLATFIPPDRNNKKKIRHAVFAFRKRP